MITTDSDIISAVRACIGAKPEARIGVAISGGGDSVALLHILSRCFSPDDVQVFAATVDHGLRPEAADEAVKVAQLADSLGIDHQVLLWKDWDGGGNLQDQARQARYHLLSDWAKARDISTVLLGHTADDQAETVLMRLGRSAGVDGLAAIPARRVVHGVTFVRPLLRQSRQHLRDYLVRQGLSWVDDPSNDDTRYDRVKARQTLDFLEPLGITADSLSSVAKNMADARDALNWYCFAAASDIAYIEAGNVVLDLRKFRVLPKETARRLLLSAIIWITSSPYPPRRAPVLAALTALRNGESVTVGGCHGLCHGHAIWLCREFQAVRHTLAELGTVWDQRWRLSSQSHSSGQVRALGRAGLAMCPDWRDLGLPAVALSGTPSLWMGEELVAAPCAGLAAGCEAELIEGSEGFFSSILTH